MKRGKIMVEQILSIKKVVSEKKIFQSVESAVAWILLTA